PDFLHAGWGLAYLLYTRNRMGILYSRPDLIAARAEWKRAGKSVVFTNGCYDLLHPGHIRLLEQARSLGDILILALNSDDSVRRLKGPSRPLIPEQDRVEVAASPRAGAVARRSHHYRESRLCGAFVADDRAPARYRRRWK